MCTVKGFRKNRWRIESTSADHCRIVRTDVRRVTLVLGTKFVLEELVHAVLRSQFAKDLTCQLTVLHISCQWHDDDCRIHQ